MDLLLEEITRETQRAEITPAHVFLEGMAEASFANAASLIARVPTDALRLRAAYSIKTNPRRELLALARRHGFCAEVISAEELDWALSNGYGHEAIIYNGPRPLSTRPSAVHVAFADSILAFQAYAQARTAAVIGVRLHPQGIASRFGVAPEEFQDLLRCVAALPADLALGVSFHIRPEDFGERSWQDIARSILHLATQLQHGTNCRITVLDFGGGWTPGEFQNGLSHDLPQVLAEIAPALPHVREVFIEPGQAVATPCVALFSRVLEIRHCKSGAVDAILDGSIHDAPHIDAYPHRMFARADGMVRPLDAGQDRLLGCACLEYDVLAPNVSLPKTLKAGDFVAIADCGSYDSSMSFLFARGGASQGAYTSV